MVKDGGGSGGRVVSLFKLTESERFRRGTKTKGKVDDGQTSYGTPNLRRL